MKVRKMSLSKKTVMLMIVGLFAGSIQADSHRVYDIHEVIQVIQEVEGEIAAEKQREEDLRNQCFTKKAVKDGSITEKIGHREVKKHTHTYEIVRRVDCTDEMVNKYNLQKENKNKCIQAAREKVKNAVKASNDSLATTDSQGNTALNYCYTPEIYNELRASGAPFQLVPAIYFNSDVIVVVSTAALLVAAVVCECVKK